MQVGPKAHAMWGPRAALAAMRRANRARTFSRAPEAGPASDASEQAWELFHEDPFEIASTDEDIERIVAGVAARNAAPYTEILRRLVGVEDVGEKEARAIFREVVEHRRELVSVLGRPVHLRVAALDKLTSLPRKPRARRDSRPILVTPSLLEKAFEVATADSVTGLPQRTQFMNLLRHELRQRKRRSVCVAFLDLDRFKQVNDGHGHARGDDVLRAVAVAARGTLREGDVLARIGGDEFGVLLLDATLDEAEVALRRLRERFELVTSPLGTSFSVGVALAVSGEPAEQVVMRADEAMYRDKRLRSAELLSRAPSASAT